MHRHFGFQHHQHHRFGRHGMGGHMRHAMRGRGRFGRFFDQGDLKLVILRMIADQPRHGYELIKAVEEQAGGAYTPSPGVVYPTLTWLEEMGFVAGAEAAGGRKLYTVTPEGEAHLGANEGQTAGIFARMAEAAAASTAFSPQILRARENLRNALKLKTTGSALTKAQIEAICDALDAAAATVERA
ncbi:MAG: PadR family transcriptional regulator [Caulobacter sp.]|nr:PadR family transcriptional regulator [Caulobacter sp.]